MDRFFLQALVRELAPLVRDRRVRALALDRSAGLLFLDLSARPPRSLVFSFLRGASGPYLGPPSRSGGATPGLKKRLAGAAIEKLEIAELDRIVTLTLEQTRLSGRSIGAELVLEVFATRSDLYLLDRETSGILEVVSSSRPRLRAGDRYERPAPPPAAAPPARDAGELEERLSKLRASGALSPRATLLAGTGFTPLLIQEMQWLMTRGASESEAFESVRRRLETGAPVLYGGGAGEERGWLLSPLELESEEGRERSIYPSFSEALEAAASRASSEQRMRAQRSRLATALAKRLDRSRRLRENLRGEVASLEDTSGLRRRGEAILAGLTRARRRSEEPVVLVPDPHSPEGGELAIEIDPRLSLPRNAEKLFTRARKTERAREELARRLEGLEDEIGYWESLEYALRDAADLPELEALEREAADEGLRLSPPLAARGAARPPKASSAGRLKPRRFRTHRGRVLLAGRSGRSNEETTFEMAGAGDLWFHAAGVPGAHVVLRIEAGAAADELELEEAAGLAAYFSKSRLDGAVDVIVTERRNVSKIKGAPPGTVRVRNRRTLRVAPRLLPEEAG